MLDRYDEELERLFTILARGDGEDFAICNESYNGIEKGTVVKINYDKYDRVISITFDNNKKPTSNQLTSWFCEDYPWPIPNYCE